MNEISFEDEKTLKDWLRDFNKLYDQGYTRITIPLCPYSYPETQRELIRRNSIKEEINSHKVDVWLAQHKIQPCPICGREFSRKGRGMTYHAAKKHVINCKGEQK